MFKLRSTFIFFILLLLLTSTFSSEIALQSYGFDDIEIVGPNQLICQTINIQKFDEQKSGILSINASFLGEIGDNTFVKVIFNDLNEKIIWPENFNCENGCVARIFTPPLSEDVKTTICLNSGGKAINSKIFKSSIVGVYDTPVLEIEHISPISINLGERAKMLIRVKNKGNLPADIFVQFLAEDLRTFLKITSFDIVEGDASAKVTILPSQEKEFFYYIKPTNPSSYNLPSAVLTFTNIFGEVQKIASNHPQLDVINQERIELISISQGLTENIFSFKILIKNNWGAPFKGTISITPTDLVKESVKEVSLNPFEEKELEFNTNNLNPGQYSILAQISEGEEFFVSESMDFVVNKKDYSFEILFSVITILIAIAIFAWIYFQKN